MGPVRQFVVGDFGGQDRCVMGRIGVIRLEMITSSLIASIRVDPNAGHLMLGRVTKILRIDLYPHPCSLQKGSNR